MKEMITLPRHLSNPSFSRSTLTVRAGEIEIIRSDTQHARTIVFVHGFAVSERYLRPLTRALSGRFNTVNVNLPGFGTTKKPARALSISELSDALQEFLVLQGINRPLLVGQSMGCQIVAKLAERHEEGIDKIILLSPTTNRRERSRVVQFVRLLQDSTREPPRLNYILLRDFARFGVLRALRTARYMVSDKIENSLKGVSGQILIIRGAKDVIVPQTWVDYLQQATKRIETVTVPAQPHNFQYTQPATASKICADFFER